MKRLLITMLAASAMLPSAAYAQAIPAAVVAVVDLEKVTSQCNACKTANNALRAQATSQETREKALAAPLQTEQQSIQTAANALNGKEPDAALQARVKAFETKAQQDQEQAAAGRQQLQRNQQYIQKQIADKLGLSVHTVNAYLGSATIKLDSVNRIQAIAKAIRLGYIS